MEPGIVLTSWTSMLVFETVVTWVSGLVVHPHIDVRCAPGLQPS